MTSRRVVLGLALVALVQGGCALMSSPTDPWRFFTLASHETKTADDRPDAGGRRVVGLGPILLPAYLGRAEIVTRVGPNEIRPAAADRWAEPLAEGFARALRDDLEAALGGSRVVLYPWGGVARPELVATVSVLRFEPTSERTVELVARWTVRRSEASAPLVRRTSEIKEPVQAEGTGAAVAALGRAVGALSREIAGVVTATPGS
jgi:uncharacterized lipoprotein YmbA